MNLEALRAALNSIDVEACANLSAEDRGELVKLLQAAEASAIAAEFILRQVGKP
jgi:hypothetical protein